MRSFVPRKKGFGWTAGLAIAISAITVAGLVQAASASTLPQGASSAANTHAVAAKAAAPALAAPFATQVTKDNIRVLLYRSYLPSSGNQDQIAVPKLSYRNLVTGKVTPIPSCRRFANPTDFVQGGKSILTILGDMVGQLGSRFINQFPFCGWWIKVEQGAVNIAFPDKAAAYWAAPFIATKDTELLVDGVYPDNRYMTLTVYDGDSDFYTYRGRTSIIHDFEINPNRGSKNPWQVNTAPGGAWHVAITPNPGRNEANVIPSFSFPPKPVTGKLFGLSSPCGTKSDSPYPCGIDYAFARSVQALQGSVWSNPDNAYVSATANPGLGDVTVIRGKLPRTVLVPHPQVWRPNSLRLDMRYMSFCVAPYVKPYPTLGSNPCVYDSQFVTDKAGYYTLVFSTRASRPRNATTANGVNWIQAVPGVTNILIMRNMLTTNFFNSAPANAPKDSNWTSTYKVLGPYYPVATVLCSTRLFQQKGAAGCYATPAK